MPAKRLAIVYIRLESIVEILSGGVFQAVRDALPAGAKITGYWMDHSQHDPQLALRLEHESLRATREGESVYALAPPTITAIRPPVTHEGASQPSLKDPRGKEWVGEFNPEALPADIAAMFSIEPRPFVAEFKTTKYPVDVTLPLEPPA